MSNNPVAHSFHNSLLRDSDLKILDGALWLNDNLIGFFFEYLEKIVCKCQSDKVAFLCPGVTQLVKSSQEAEVGILVDPLNLHSKDYIFLPINDSTSSQVPGGTHWSLLMFDRSSNVFQHYDSLGGANTMHAQKVANKLIPCLHCATTAAFQVMECPQQINGYDCGLHVILNTEVLVKHFVFNEVLGWYDKFDSKEKRANLKKLIQSVQ